MDLTQIAQNDSKSSAGDKHETARAMMQIEHEKIAKQLLEVIHVMENLEKINPENKTQKIAKESLIKTNNGLLFLSIALGKVVLDVTLVMVLSFQSLQGIKLLNLDERDANILNGVKYTAEKMTKKDEANAEIAHTNVEENKIFHNLFSIFKISKPEHIARDFLFIGL